MHVLLCDIDGTLINTHRAGSTAMHAALAAEFGVEEPAVVDFAGRTDRAIVSEFLHSHDLPVNDDSVARFCQAYVRQLERTLVERGGVVLPGVVDLLTHSGGRNDVALGLLTGNLQAGAMRKLAHFELESHFAFGGYGDHHLERDDVAREAYRAARNHLLQEVPPERVIVLGDTTRDIACARAIGARVVAVATGGHSYEQLAAEQPDVLLRDLSTFEFVLELLEG